MAENMAPPPHMLHISGIKVGPGLISPVRDAFPRGSVSHVVFCVYLYACESSRA